MADGDYRPACAHCGSVIAHRINKTTGLPSKAPRKFCNKRCTEGWHRVRHDLGRDRSSKPRTLTCIGCHREVVRRVRGGRSDAGKFCTKACALQDKIRLSEEAKALRLMLRRQRKADKQAAAAMKATAVDMVPCCVCSTSMARPKFGWANRSCCSDACREVRYAEARRRLLLSDAGRARKRKAKAKRRAVERGHKADNIDPLRVFSRDGWRCHLCGCRTPESLRGSHAPKAPELDHVITLADGGQHTWGNVACACRACNQAKGARSSGQLGFDLAA